MLQTFLSTLQPMLTLFLFISLGFLLAKTKILPENSGKVFAKILTYAVCPALSFTSMAQYFTVDTFNTHLFNLILGAIGLVLAISLSLLLARFFVKDKKAYELGVYKYALTFGNMGYVGDPVVISLFGIQGLAFYKIIGLPFSIAIYSWGVSILVPKGEKKKSLIKSLLNAPTIGLFVGMFFGITGLGKLLYSTPGLKFVTDTLSGLASCMGPIAMLLAGVTIARFDFKKMLTNKKVYVATILRLIVLPTILIAFVFGVKCLLNLAFNLNLDNSFLFLFFFAVSTPLGMNTIVFPEAYGGDPSTGVSMTLISHVLCVITIPLMFALLTLLFGPQPIF